MSMARLPFLLLVLLIFLKRFFSIQTIICKDNDPPWMIDEIKRVCMDKSKVYRQEVKHGYTINAQKIYKNLPLTVLVL